MNKVRVNAKINMTLDVVGSYKEGYHNLDMTMISVGIFDVVEVVLSDSICVTMDGRECDESNTAYKVADICQKEYDMPAVKIDTSNPAMEHTPQIILNKSIFHPPLSFFIYYHYSISQIHTQLKLLKYTTKKPASTCPASPLPSPLIWPRFPVYPLKGNYRPSAFRGKLAAI